MHYWNTSQPTKMSAHRRMVDISNRICKSGLTQDQNAKKIDNKSIKYKNLSSQVHFQIKI